MLIEELKSLIKDLYEEMSKASDIQDYLKKNPKATAREVHQATGIDLNSIGNKMSKMRKEGLLGGGRGEVEVTKMPNALKVVTKQIPEAEKRARRTKAEMAQISFSKLDDKTKKLFNLFDSGLWAKYGESFTYWDSGDWKRAAKDRSAGIRENVTIDQAKDPNFKLPFSRYEIGDRILKVKDLNESKERMKKLEEWEAFRKKYPKDLESKLPKKEPVEDDLEWKLNSSIPDYEHDGDIDSWKEYLKERMKDAGIDPKQFKYSSRVEQAERDYDEEEDYDNYEDNGWVIIHGKGSLLKKKVLDAIN